MQTPDGEAVPDYSARFRLDERGVVVLGGGRGIGRQVVHALAQSGARVAVVDVDKDRAEAVAAEIGGRGVAIAGDVTSRPEMERIAEQARTGLGGRVHGVVDVVGLATFAPLVELDEDDWSRDFGLVLKHAWLALRCFAPAMSAAGGGSFAFVASISGLSTAPRHSAYGAFKAGLISLVRTAAVELGGDGIRVNAVAPGAVWTPRVSVELGAAGHERLASTPPLGRLALPADVASALLFLSTDLASYVTGQTLVVDGGVGAIFPLAIGESAGSAARS